MARVLRRTALATTGLACAALAASVASAQVPAPADPDPIAAARALFAQALGDEEAGRFALALDEFQRVRAVRDTAAVEYRIGSCYEGLGQPAPAFRAYLAAQVLGASDPLAADVSQAAADRLDALGKQVARLTLTMPSPAPPSPEVRVDDRVVETGGPTALAPGRHVVTATAPGALPFRSEIALTAGAQVSLTVALEPVPRPRADEPASERDLMAPARWLVVGGGAALVATSAVLLIVRHDDIADLNRACPGGACPSGANEQDLESTRHRAQVYGPVGVACGVAGIGLAAAGIYWMATARRSVVAGRMPAIVPMVGMVGERGAGLSLAGVLR
ncbi:MAG TPA: hypothetical protein VK762_11950 [Polyangiaceae bacterium]|nr:hypothetical protein [Polyangiaceae bacterium]